MFHGNRLSYNRSYRSGGVYRSIEAPRSPRMAALRTLTFPSLCPRPLPSLRSVSAAAPRHPASGCARLATQLTKDGALSVLRFRFYTFFAGDVSLPSSRTSKKRRSRCISTGDRSLPSLSACRKRLQDHPEFPIRTSFRAVLFCAKVIKYYLWPQYEPKIHR